MAAPLAGVFLENFALAFARGGGSLIDTPEFWRRFCTLSVATVVQSAPAGPINRGLAVHDQSLWQPGALDGRDNGPSGTTSGAAKVDNVTIRARIHQT